MIEILKVIVLACTLSPDRGLETTKDILKAQKDCRVSIMNCINTKSIEKTLEGRLQECLVEN